MRVKIEEENIIESRSEVFDILMDQYFNRMSNLNKKQANVVFLVYRVFVFFLGVYVAFISVEHMSTNVNDEIFNFKSVFLMFLSIFILAYSIFFNKILMMIKNTGTRTAKKRNMKISNDFLALSKGFVGCYMEYNVVNNNMVCAIEKEGKKLNLWTHKLKGVAIIGDYACVVFKKKTSIYPTFSILHTDKEALRKELIAQGLVCLPKSVASADASL